MRHDIPAFEQMLSKMLIVISNNEITVIQPIPQTENPVTVDNALAEERPEVNGNSHRRSQGGAGEGHGPP